MDVIIKTAGPTPDARLSLKQALLDFRTVLSPEEQANLDRSLATSSAPTAASVLDLTQEIDNNNAGRRTRKIGARLQPFLDGIQQFTAIVDAFIGFGPSIAETVWGIVKIALLLASNASSYFEKLSELLKSIGDSCPRFQDYALLYQGSRRLQNALCAYFEQVIRLARQAVKISRTPAAIRLVRTALWLFDADFGPIQANLNEAAIRVSEEVDLASAKLQIEEAELSKLERKEASDGRKLLAAFSATTRNEIAELKHRWHNYDIRQKRRIILQIMARLCAFDCTTAWRRVYKQAVAGTAEWFAIDTVYRNWIASPTGQILLVVGSLGSGKSVLVANMVATLRAKASKDLQLAHFFCPNSSDPSITPDSLCCSLIGQLIEPHLETLSLQVLDQVEAWSASKSWRRILDICTTSMDPTMSYCIVVDNLEYLNGDATAQVLQNVQEIYDTISQIVTVRVLLSLRSGTDTAAGEKFSHARYLHLSRPRIDADVRVFVAAALAEKYDMGQLQLSDVSLIGHICEYIVEGAQGMFLWARLVLEQICHLPSDGSIVEALRRLPTGLLDMFELLLDQTCRNSKCDFLPSLFMWSLGSRRPLTLDELAQALSLQRGQSRLGPSRGRQDVVMAIAATRGLLGLDMDELTVSPVHHSFRQYLLQERVTSAESHLALSPTVIDAEIGHLTMMYLTFEEFASQLVKIGQNKDLAQATKRILPATHQALAVESKTVQSIVRIRSVLANASSRSPSPDARSKVDHDIEARLGDLWLQLSEKTKRQTQDASQFPFLKYAAKYWYTHVITLNPNQDESSWRLFVRLFSNKVSRYDQPWYDDMPLEPPNFVEWYTEDGNPHPLARWSDEDKKVMGWACANHHFAAIEAQLISLHRPPREVRWSDRNETGEWKWKWTDRYVAPILRRLDRTLLAEPLRCKETAAIACRHPHFFGAYDSRRNAHGLDSFVAVLAVRFNLPEHLEDTPDSDGRPRQWPEWKPSELNQIGFLVLPDTNWPSWLRGSDEKAGEPDAIPGTNVGSGSIEDALVRQDIWFRLRRPLSLSQMAILYGSNEAYLKLQHRFTDPTPTVDQAFAALLGQNVDIAELLVTRLHQPSDPTPDIPNNLILFAIWVDQLDIAAVLCEVKSRMIFEEEGGLDRWARLHYYLTPKLWTRMNNPGDPKLEEALLLKALWCAFDEKAVNLFRALVSCFVRPYRLPPDHSIPEHMRQRAEDQCADPEFARMVNLYEDTLKITPSGPGKNDRHPFFLRVVQTETVVLPLAAVVWVLGSAFQKHISSPFITAVIACGSIWTFIFMLARPKGENSLPASVRGAFNILGLAFNFVGFLLEL